jgi:hypothetical protein
MFERFTDKARKVVILAKTKATDRGDDQIGPVHMLYGLAAADGVAARALASLGVDAAALERELGRASSAGGASPGPLHPSGEQAGDAEALAAISHLYRHRAPPAGPAAGGRAEPARRLRGGHAPRPGPGPGARPRAGAGRATAAAGMTGSGSASEQLAEGGRDIAVAADRPDPAAAQAGQVVGQVGILLAGGVEQDIQPG